MEFAKGEACDDAAAQRTADLRAQTERALKNMGAVLEAGGASYASVVKATVLLSDIADFQVVNAVYAEFFPADKEPPARAAYAAAGLPKNALVEIECTAMVL
eukprot:TRINITY_DN20110_c0_g1_i1.p1 TRINITY_DN20110_c0_g1~~TRINITY_DN20110_c0_g1_i1.p1  ORF type:complete len:102 (-),score=13.26 TRINITY_DN20110_c0_g1_i1:80-385(-)